MAALSSVTAYSESILESSPCELLEKKFKAEPLLKGIIIIDHDKGLPKGAISKNYLLNVLSSAFGRELYLSKSVGYFLEQHAKHGITLILSPQTTLEDALSQALTRSQTQRYDPILVWDKNDNDAGLIDMDELLLFHLKETEKLNSRLSKANRDKNEMLGIASHDLKNPLGAISSLAELMLNNELPD